MRRLWCMVTVVSIVKEKDIIIATSSTKEMTMGRWFTGTLWASTAEEKVLHCKDLVISVVKIWL